MNSLDDRTDVLRHLLSFDRPIEDLAADVARLPWDCDASLVVLTRSHIDAVLKRYITGALDDAGVHAWADLIECREDIAFDPEASASIDELIHELANPVLHGPLTIDRARHLIGTP